MNTGEWNGLNILVAEDEEDLRTVLCSFIKKKGASVFSAANGIEAYKVIQENDIDIVISDVQMPLCNGIELVEKIRRLHPSVPVVFLATGFSDVNESEAKAIGASGLIQKPFKMAALVPLIENVLKNRRFV